MSFYESSRLLAEEAVESGTALNSSSCSNEEIEQLILDHRENGRKLARSFLRRWRVRMPAEEIDSIVDLTLCEAARRYDSTRGASFMTFLFYHLRGQFVRAVESAANNHSFMLHFSQVDGVDISEWAVTGSGSDAFIYPEQSNYREQDITTPESLLLKRENVDICLAACSELDELEQQIIKRSFSGDEPLVDIARSLGYSRCHISRVKKRALDRLHGLISRAHGAESVVEKESRKSCDRVERSSALERRGFRRSSARRARRASKEVQTTAKKAVG